MELRNQVSLKPDIKGIGELRNKESKCKGNQKLEEFVS